MVKGKESLTTYMPPSLVEKFPELPAKQVCHGPFICKGY